MRQEPPTFEQLYREAELLRERKTKKREAMLKKREEEEMKEMQKGPKTNSKARYLKKGGPNEDLNGVRIADGRPYAEQRRSKEVIGSNQSPRQPKSKEGGYALGAMTASSYLQRHL